MVATRTPDDTPPRARIEITSDTASTFRETDSGRCIRVLPSPAFGAGDAVFTIGSSFAHSVRSALQSHGQRPVPDYASVPLDPTSQTVGPLRHVNYYTAATIRQEIERALSSPSSEPSWAEIAPGRWKVAPDKFGLSGDFEPWEARYQDPRRHGVVARTEPAIIDLMAKLDALSLRSLAEASAYVVTLSLTEAWVDTRTGHHVWSNKVARVAPDPDRYEFRPTGFAENHDDIEWVCNTIATRFPGRPIVLTVSPVSPPRTFGDDDAVVANAHSKAVLRAVAGSVATDFDHVTYWPSFEYSMASADRQDDGRHMTQATVQHDVEQFVAAYSDTGKV